MSSDCCPHYLRICIYDVGPGIRVMNVAIDTASSPVTTPSYIVHLVEYVRAISVKAHSLFTRDPVEYVFTTGLRSTTVSAQDFRLYLLH